MLPKTHTVLGLIVSIILYVIFKITLFEAFLVLFASIFIDFDHYLWHIFKKKDFSLKKAYHVQKEEYELQKKGESKNHKPVLHVFHTIEFFIFIVILSYFWNIFLFILLGMIFHSFLDMVEMSSRGCFKNREYFLIRYLLSDKNKYC